VSGHNLRTAPRKAVRSAEWLLWFWTVWTTGAGIFQSWTTLPNLLANQVAGLVSVSSDTLHEVIVVFYVMVAILSVWIIWWIGAGKRWARSSLLLSFIADAVWTLAPPNHGLSGYLSAVPDLGLQAIAIYLLYVRPGRSWFEKKPLQT
jgi:hypothetical protein